MSLANSSGREEKESGSGSYDSAQEATYEGEIQTRFPRVGEKSL